ncbi:inner membrane protein YiaH [Clostridium acetireducens DSM 10703]|uniref:Inner membrane protein YiaH n=1 Tax=Clostridium acetireducens DSM 10703 TaxID=1121290 RepID=A0A1E8EYQ2_9CLOT|nr:acyltransferase family protein [Clostridium acetireducens]OFI05819.1 inner membrane protein YiaH [Clostridium acetireducens DSM 10703]
MIINNKRIIEMDMARGLATLAVIIIHTSSMALYNNGNVQSLNYTLCLVLNQLTRFSVPLFVLLSGMGLTLSYKYKSYFSFLKHRLLKIWPYYIFWCVLYILFITKDSFSAITIKYVFTGKIYYHFYFVFLITQFYIIYPFFKRFFESKVGFVLLLVFNAVILFSSFQYNFPNSTIHFWDKKNMLYWLFYFSFGCFLGKYFYKINFKKGKILYILLFIFSTYIILKESISLSMYVKDIDYYTKFLRPSVFLYSLCFTLFIFSINFNKVLKSFLKYISKVSFDIYLVHPFILHYILMFYKKHHYNAGTIYFCILAFLISLIASIIIAEIKKKVIKN